MQLFTPVTPVTELPQTELYIHHHFDIEEYLKASRRLPWDTSDHQSITLWDKSGPQSYNSWNKSDDKDKWMGGK